MRILAFLIIMAISSQSAFPQSDSILKLIFVPHPRSENRTQQSVIPAIEKIDFSKYDITLLGGDLTWYTSISRISMDYCDSLFHLKSPNTLWTLGNHDRNNLKLLEEYTGRKSFYTYFRDKITFVVLDTERDADGFQSSFIRGEQLEMLENVCDTITNSDFMVVLHHRLLWMINNNDFSTRIDSVGESTKQLDTTNFYQEVYPLLLKAKKNGVRIICLGGDKSKINIEYLPTDSITFFTSTMAPEFDDSINHVIVFSYNRFSSEMKPDFIPLNKVLKTDVFPVSASGMSMDDLVLRSWTKPDFNEIIVEMHPGMKQVAIVNLYALSGELRGTKNLMPGEKYVFRVQSKGVYFVRATSGNSAKIIKLVLQ